jgi:acyl-CoA thioesterase
MGLFNFTMLSFKSQGEGAKKVETMPVCGDPAFRYFQHQAHHSSQRISATTEQCRSFDWSIAASDEWLPVDLHFVGFAPMHK